MFVEELSKIKECEDKAEKIRKDAKAKSVKSIEAAKAEAEKIIEEAESKSADIHEGGIALGEEESEKDYNASIERTRKQALQLSEKAKPNMEKAVTLITERMTMEIGRASCRERV